MANNIFDFKNVQELVKSGEISVNSVFPWKQYDEISVLQFAIINSDDGFIDFLLANNISLSKTTERLGTALDVAIKKQKLDVVKKLVISGAEINPTQYLCETSLPLHQAIHYGNYDIIEFLIMSGAEVNAEVHKATFNRASYNFSALNLAISKMDIRIIKLLLNNNAIIDQGSDEVHSSLHLAARLNRVDILQILEEFGAKFEVIKDQDYTLEFDAAIRHDNIDIVNFFFKNCDNFLDIADSYGDTVAHLAVQFSCINILRYLLDCGTNINMINYDNSSLLDIAMEININHTLRNQIENQSLEIIKVIENHIIKLSAANIFVNKKNLRAVDGDIFKSFREKCKKEISKLKINRISKTNFNYYNVLEKNLHRLAVGLTNLDYCINEIKILTEFPLYGNFMVQKLRRAVERKELVKNAENLYEIFYMHLPDLVVRNIFNYLSNADLKLLSQ